MPDPLDRFPCSRYQSSKAMTKEIRPPLRHYPRGSLRSAQGRFRPLRLLAERWGTTVPVRQHRRRLTVRAYATACALADRYVRAHWCANRRKYGCYSRSRRATSRLWRW